MSEKNNELLTRDPHAMSLTRKIVIVSMIMLPVIFVVGYGITRNSSTVKSTSKIVDWGVYRQFDAATGKLTLELQSLDGQKVRSPGFMVPLEDNRSETTEFLLVPSPQACIHAPPPPSNQMIYVRMVGAPAKTLYGPVMVEGTLRVTSQTHQYGVANFQIYGDFAEPYASN